MFFVLPESTVRPIVDGALIELAGGVGDEDVGLVAFVEDGGRGQNERRC